MTTNIAKCRQGGCGCELCNHDMIHKFSMVNESYMLQKIPGQITTTVLLSLHNWHKEKFIKYLYKYKF